jgi:methylated-DNA-[protein]-cysteine S-methyltransferase
MSKRQPRSRSFVRPAKPAAKDVAAPPQAVVFSSEIGWIALAWRGSKLAQVSFAHPSPAAAMQRIDVVPGIEPSDLDDAPAWIQNLAANLQRYVTGEKVSFGKVPLDMDDATEFQRRIQDACRAIPRGRVLSYGELATAAGSPGAARAVGSAMRTNRFPLVVPCHRVVAAGGNLGGFSCPQGIDIKRKLLALEGVKLRSGAAS